MYESTRQEEHPTCIVCSTALKDRLGLEFRPSDSNTVEATFVGSRLLEGYPHVLHGGVICAVLDGAMTNCLFAIGKAAVTGDLHVRFRRPVAATGVATIRAWIKSASPPLYRLAANLIQDDVVKATATARFLEKDAATRIVERELP